MKWVARKMGDAGATSQGIRKVVEGRCAGRKTRMKCWGVHCTEPCQRRERVLTVFYFSFYLLYFTTELADNSVS